MIIKKRQALPLPKDLSGKKKRQALPVNFWIVKKRQALPLPKDLSGKKKEASLAGKFLYRKKAARPAATQRLKCKKKEASFAGLITRLSFINFLRRLNNCLKRLAKIYIDFRRLSQGGKIRSLCSLS